MLDQSQRIDHVIARYLRQHEGGEVVNRAELIEQHPQLRSGLESFFSIYDQAQSGTDGVEDDGSAPGWSFRAGQLLGRYRLLRMIGIGSFGQVWLGFDEELRRAVAVKVPSPNRFRTAGETEAFVDEARVVASLDHPHIVSIYDIGTTPEGLVYLVTQFIAGQDLATWICERPPSIAQSARLIATVATALGYAHDCGLIHRDIKPSNILIEAATGTPFVTDFGLAIQNSSTAAREQIAGTPAYMSPEQARSDGQPLDGRSDIFSLGVGFYRMLTGSRPFVGDDRSVVIANLLNSNPQPPKALNHKIPDQLQRICLRMLAKDRANRYDDAHQVASELWAWIRESGSAGLSTMDPVELATRGSGRGDVSNRNQSDVIDTGSEAITSTIRGPAGKPRRRSLVWIGGAAAIAAIGIAGSVFFATRPKENLPPKSASVLPAANTAMTPDREIAIEILQMGGSVDVYHQGDSFEVDNPTDLPDGKFDVHWAMLPHVHSVDDAFVGRLLSLRQLQGVDLTQSSVTSSGFQQLAQIPTLEFVYARETDLDDDAVETLAQLPQLVGLSLADTKISDRSLQILAGHPKLSELNVMGTAVTNDGIKHVASMNQLLLLRIASTEVGDAGLAHLKDLQNVRLLWAKQTKITDAGLAAMKEWPLREFSYSKGMFSREALSQFKLDHPRCRLIEE